MKQKNLLKERGVCYDKESNKERNVQRNQGSF